MLISVCTSAYVDRCCGLRGPTGRDTTRLFPESNVNRVSCIKTDHESANALVIKGRYVLVRRVQRSLHLYGTHSLSILSRPRLELSH